MDQPTFSNDEISLDKVGQSGHNGVRAIVDQLGGVGREGCSLRKLDVQKRACASDEQKRE